MKKYYSTVRALHLYFGLFISPFILIFGISVIVFNHPSLINSMSPVVQSQVKAKLERFPQDTTNLLIAKSITRQLGINGEVDFINHTDDRMSFPVRAPGLVTNISVDKHTDSVTIVRREEGAYRAMSFLHSMPGQHNEKLRGNSAFLKAWRVIADVVVYVVLFLTATGVFLWYFLKVERNLGYFSITLGVAMLVVLMLVIF